VSAESSTHPSLELDEVVHQRVRLGILAVLSEASECTFGVLRNELGLTDGNLGGHIRILEQAGLIEVHKGYEGRRPCTWLRLTRDGRTALRNEVAALERLVARLRTAESDTDP
jgi:DNA-binding MarR family transcriptional regulator